MTAASLPSRSILSRLSRSFETASVVLALAAATGCVPSADTGSDTTTETSSDTVPERVVEVVESGSKGPTVVFESGLGADWTPWKKVAEEVSAQARTFAYSRPGYGQSEPSPEPRDPAQIVEDLRGLLAARDVAPPYLLVGHSFGGAYMELFAKAHPEEVLGVVLVDPRHRDFATACEADGFDGCTIPASVVDKLPRVQKDEIQGFELASAQIHAAGGFGKYPVRVLTATMHGGFAPPVEDLWESMLGSLADEAADGEQHLFVGVGHNIQLQRPHEVAQEILSLLPAPEGG